MFDLTQMLQEIEKVRSLLNKLVMAKCGDTADPEVANLSSHLDELIVRYENLKTVLGSERED